MVIVVMFRPLHSWFVRLLRGRNRVAAVITLILATPQKDFPVVQGSRVVGILPSRELMVALQEQGSDALVESVMRRDFLLLDANEMLETALARMHVAECCMTAPVMQRDTMIGLLTAENVSELLLIVSALGERKSRNATIAPSMNAADGPERSRR